MDRKSQQCMAQIILEIGQDSLRQYLFQNTLHLSIRSHQKPILSNYNTSNLLINPLRGRFLFLSKTANWKNKESRGGGVTVNWYHVQCITSHLLGILRLCRRRHTGSFPQWGVRDINPILLQLLTLPRNGSKDVPKLTRTRQNSAQQCRINQNCLLKSLASDSCSERMTPQPTATYDSPN